MSVHQLVAVKGICLQPGSDDKAAVQEYDTCQL
jgi:hypothetical protein